MMDVVYNNHTIISLVSSTVSSLVVPSLSLSTLIVVLIAFFPSIFILDFYCQLLTPTFVGIYPSKFTLSRKNSSI